MAKLRADLIGAVHFDGEAFFAGDELPADAVIHESLLAEEKAAKPRPSDGTEGPKRGRPRKKPDPQPDDGAIDA